MGEKFDLKSPDVRAGLEADGWRRNTGRCPEDLQEDGKKIDVIMRSGERAKTAWIAWGRGGAIWEIRRYGFDIAFFREAK